MLGHFNAVKYNHHQYKKKRREVSKVDVPEHILSPKLEQGFDWNCPCGHPVLQAKRTRRTLSKVLVPSMVKAGQVNNPISNTLNWSGSQVFAPY